jgi:hypothetical protein
MRRAGAIAWCLGLITACGATPGGDSPFDPAATSTGAVESGSSEASGGADAPGTTADGSGSGGDDTDPVKLDVAHDTDGPQGGGCEKVDFLFVIDSSGSMKEEQDQLIASFPGFVAAIEQSVAVDDFQVMVVDSDESFILDQCGEICPANPEDSCGACANDVDCTYVECASWPPPPTCDTRIGAGRRTTPIGDDCAVVGDQRFLTTAQPDLGTAFACVAAVGIGASAERPMDAMTAAVGPMLAPGECNEGFLRDDAILVVTVISDEDDSPEDDDIASSGDPDAWKSALVAAKLGNEEAIVFLGLVGDTDLPNAICQGDPAPEAAAAPSLRQLAGSFVHGQWGSVCVDDYAPFFADAIAVIDTACDDFEPPG